MKMTLTLVLFLVAATTVMGQFDPLVNVESCTKSKLVVSTFDASDNGLIYIQGQDESCKRMTFSGLALYEFDFVACNIEWEMLLRIVIQKNSGYQTGVDKIIPIFCVADRSDLIVTNANNAKKADDGSQNITVKPSARMAFYKVVSEEEVSGKEVKLSDTLIMALQLESQFTDDFDIKARYCIASGIVIIENFCSTDTDLFPNFYKLRNGYLMSEFGAFRPTNLNGEALEMNFTCILEVCKDSCQETFCGGNEIGVGRKRRELELNRSFYSKKNYNQVDAPGEDHQREKRQEENFDIDVGANVKIVEKYSEIQIVTEETLCLKAALLITVMIFLSTCVVGFAGSSVMFYKKWSYLRLLTENQSRMVKTMRMDAAFSAQKRGNNWNSA